MKRSMTALTAALMGSAFALAPALAADSGVKADIDAGASVKSDTAGGAASTYGSTDNSMTQELNASSMSSSNEVSATAAASAKDTNEIVNSIRSTDRVASNIETMGDVSHVSVVRLDENSGSNARIEKAINANKADVDRLRNSINANAKLSSALKAKNVDRMNVVAAHTGADGSLTVYVR